MPLRNLIASDFEEFAHALTQEALEYKDRGSSVGYLPTGKAYRGDGKADAILPSGVFGRPLGSTPGLVIFSHKTTGAEDDKTSRKNLRSYFLRDIEDQVAQSPSELVLLYNRELNTTDSEAVKAKVAKVTMSQGKAPFPVFFYGPIALRSMAERHKHILWRWFGGSPFVKAVHCEDEDAVLDALGIVEIPTGISKAPRGFPVANWREAVSGLLECQVLERAFLSHKLPQCPREVC